MLNNMAFHRRIDGFWISNIVLIIGLLANSCESSKKASELGNESMMMGISADPVSSIQELLPMIRPEVVGHQLPRNNPAFMRDIERHQDPRNGQNIGPEIIDHHDPRNRPINRPAIREHQDPGLMRNHKVSNVILRPVMIQSPPVFHFLQDGFNFRPTFKDHLNINRPIQIKNDNVEQSHQRHKLPSSRFKNKPNQFLDPQQYHQQQLEIQIQQQQQLHQQMEQQEKQEQMQRPLGISDGNQKQEKSQQSKQQKTKQKPSKQANNRPPQPRQEIPQLKPPPREWAHQQEPQQHQQWPGHLPSPLPFPQHPSFQQKEQQKRTRQQLVPDLQNSIFRGHFKQNNRTDNRFSKASSAQNLHQQSDFMNAMSMNNERSPPPEGNRLTSINQPPGQKNPASLPLPEQSPNHENMPVNFMPALISAMTDLRHTQPFQNQQIGHPPNLPQIDFSRNQFPPNNDDNNGQLQQFQNQQVQQHHQQQQQHQQALRQHQQALQQHQQALQHQQSQQQKQLPVPPTNTVPSNQNIHLWPVGQNDQINKFILKNPLPIMMMSNEHSSAGMPNSNNPHQEATKTSKNFAQNFESLPPNPIPLSPVPQQTESLQNVPSQVARPPQATRTLNILPSFDRNPWRPMVSKQPFPWKPLESLIKNALETTAKRLVSTPSTFTSPHSQVNDMKSVPSVDALLEELQKLGFKSEADSLKNDGVFTTTTSNSPSAQRIIGNIKDILNSAPDTVTLSPHGQAYPPFSTESLVTDLSILTEPTEALLTDLMTLVDTVGEVQKLPMTTPSFVAEFTMTSPSPRPPNYPSDLQNVAIRQTSTIGIQNDPTIPSTSLPTQNSKNVMDHIGQESGDVSRMRFNTDLSPETVNEIRDRLRSALANLIENSSSEAPPIDWSNRTEQLKQQMIPAVIADVFKEEMGMQSSELSDLFTKIHTDDGLLHRDDKQMIADGRRLRNLGERAVVASGFQNYTISSMVNSSDHLSPDDVHMKRINNRDSFESLRNPSASKSPDWKGISVFDTVHQLQFRDGHVSTTAATIVKHVKESRSTTMPNEKKKLIVRLRRKKHPIGNSSTSTITPRLLPTPR